MHCFPSGGTERQEVILSLTCGWEPFARMKDDLLRSARPHSSPSVVAWVDLCGYDQLKMSRKDYGLLSGNINIMSTARAILGAARFRFDF